MITGCNIVKTAAARDWCVYIYEFIIFGNIISFKTNSNIDILRESIYG